jgi:hypothetical protein
MVELIMHEERTLNVQRFENTLTRDDFFVDLTIYDIPVSLLEDFSEYVVTPVYNGQVNEAIKDLMRKAILKQKLAVNK